MKGLYEFYQESELVKNVIKHELKQGLEVFLLINMRTDNTLLTSNPVYFGGENKKKSIGIICGNEDALADDTYTPPMESFTCLDELPY